MSELTERELAGLLRILTPAPAHWVEAAQQIPQVKKQLAEVLPYLESTASGRAAETAELEKAIEAVGSDAGAAADRRASAPPRAGLSSNEQTEPGRLDTARRRSAEQRSSTTTCGRRRCQLALSRRLRLPA